MFMAARSKRVALVGSGMACMLCIGFLMSLAILDNGGRQSTPPVIAGDAAATLSSSRVRPKHSMDSDPFSNSKRKVPNGPDPIHNRRRGKSGWPPSGV